MSLMQRKPTKAKEDTSDDFIGGATIEIFGKHYRQKCRIRSELLIPTNVLSETV